MNWQEQLDEKLMTCEHISQGLISGKDDCSVWFSTPQRLDDWQNQPLPEAECLFREDEEGAWVAFAATEKFEGEEIKLAGYSYTTQGTEELVYPEDNDVKVIIGKASNPDRAILIAVTCQSLVFGVCETGKGHDVAEAQRALLNLAGYMKQNYF